ncbi:MAG: DNA alkylation repair protein [Blastochloris sp.]|nr:DNA alkylation repair protein [Blastochloris sp.]
MSSTKSPLLQQLQEMADPDYAVQVRRFFKDGPGGYAEGDVFMGVRIPQIRKLLPQTDSLSLSQLEKILHSKKHEERLLALLALVRRYEQSDDTLRLSIVKIYLDNSRWINNWDLVDLTAHKILGAWLLTREREVLETLSCSPLLWERRIAVVSTYAFIRKRQLADTFLLSKKLLKDPEDLMHKACGWMLREAGKRDEAALCQFLDMHRGDMPRTMLRYAIEKFAEPKRQRYLR